MRKYEVKIYEVKSELTVKIEANNTDEAVALVQNGLTRQPHSDYNESDFKKSLIEYVVVPV